MTLALATASGCGGRCGDDTCDMAGGETCDGCPDDCAEEPICITPVCGNGVIEGIEECDDGNTDSGDGCDASCSDEEACGNGTIEGIEECDDGNTMSGDGCSDLCVLEVGPLCGDGILDVGEECDPPDAMTCGEDCTFVFPPIECVGDMDVGVQDLTVENPVTIFPSFVPDTHVGATSCGTALGCGSGPETVVEVILPAGSTGFVIDFDHDGGDEVYAVYTDDTGMCVEAECFDPYPALAGTHVFAGLSSGAADTTVYLVVEACEAVFTTLTLTAPLCGDSAISPLLEECDDGNMDPTDGCDLCVISTGFGCVGEPSVCGAATVEMGTSSPGVPIPDGDPLGIDDTIDITTACTISHLSVDIDITHPYSGDIGLTLTAPDGTTSVVLKVPDGLDATDDVLGTYPDSLVPAEPLFGFNGVDGQGTWMLNVSDRFGMDAGTLNNWGINLSCI